MRKKVLYITISIVLFLYMYFFIKTSKDIYVGYYTYNGCPLDIQIVVNGDTILNDSLHNIPFMANYHLKKHMSNGFYTIKVTSNIANVDKQEKVLLLPYQFISIDFIGADTFCLEKKTVFKEDSSISQTVKMMESDTINNANQGLKRPFFYVIFLLKFSKKSCIYR